MSAIAGEEHRLVDFIAHSSVVTSLKLSQGSNRILATGDKEAKINIWGNWDVGKPPTNLWTLTSNKSSIESLIFDDHEQNVVSGAMNGSIKVFDLNVGRLARSLRGHQVNTCSLHYHPYGEFIVSGSGDTTMKVWDVRQKNCIQTYSGHQKELTCVRFSPDGRWVASSAKDGQLLLWDLVAGKLLHSVRLQPTYITTFEFNPMEFMLAAVTSAKTVRIWDLEIMKQIGCTYPDSSPVKALTFSKQDTCLCTASNDSVKLWHWEPVKLTGSATVPWDGIGDMAMSSSNVISGASSVGNVVSLWSIHTDFMLSDVLSRPSKAVLPVNSVSRPTKGGSISERPRDKHQQHQHQHHQNVLLPTHCADPDLAPAVFDVRRVGATRAAIAVLGEEVAFNLIESSEDIASYSEIPKGPPPEVRWESEGAAKDMATSIGDSFWNRMSASRQRDAMSNESSEKKLDSCCAPTAATAAAAKEIQETSSESYTQISMQSLEDMLPNSMGYPSTNRYQYLKSKAEDKEIEATESRKLDAKHGEVSIHNTGGSRYREKAAPREISRDLVIPSTATPSAFRPSFPPKSTPAIGRSDHNLDSFAPSIVEVDGLSVVGHRSRGHLPCTDQQVQPSSSRGQVDAYSISGIEAIVDSLNDSSAQIVAELSERLATIRALQNQWVQGDSIQVISRLLVIFDESLEDGGNENDLVALSDFLSAADLKTDGLSLDACTKLLPLFESMLNECMHLPHVVKATIDSTVMLCNAFGDLIRQTRAAVVLGVDLSLEERLRKCNSCHASLFRIRKRLEAVMRAYGHKEGNNEALKKSIVTSAKKLTSLILDI